ncbi:MAG: hypothetical protein CVU66_02500 [Deltaproteobacteria bacterium HGW-Deltaproteobacteria-23]|nr:MAG: hypothetical protein CVU66_02500 [Deltaproteobacteria bacterium HGW-Deltaproteobacteria-23]
MQSNMKKSVWDPSTAYKNPEVAELYDANRFTSITGKLGDRKERRAFSSALACLKGTQTALDIPCGTGRMTAVLLEAGLQVVGADVSEPMMQQACQKLKGFGDRVKFTEANLFQLPFPSESFDIVTCIRLFGHYPFEDRIRMLKELLRVAKRAVIVQYFYQTPLTRAKRLIKRRVLHTYEGVVYPVTEAELRQELTKAGHNTERRFWARQWYSEEVFILLTKS